MAKQTYTTGQVLTAAQMTTLQNNDYNWTVSNKTASYTLVAADVGTRVTMTNASATTITVNTGLFAAGDTLEIINLGAGVCTITAGTATVSTAGSLALSQYESGILFFTATGACVFFDYYQSSGAGSPLTTKGDLYTYSTTDTRLPVGANGTTVVADSTAATGLAYKTAGVFNGLTTTGDTIYSSSGTTQARLGIGSTGDILTVSGGVPSWAAPTGGGGMTLLSTTTLSGATTTISSISQSYVNLFITISNVTDNGNGKVYFRPNAVSDDCVEIGTQLIASSASLAQSTAADIKLTRNEYITYNSGVNAWAMVIPNYTSTTTRKLFQWYGMFTNSTPALVEANLTASNGSNSAITSIAIYNPGATFTGGTVKIYGVK